MILLDRRNRPFLLQGTNWIKGPVPYCNVCAIWSLLTGPIGSGAIGGLWQETKSDDNRRLDLYLLGCSSSRCCNDWGGDCRMNEILLSYTVAVLFLLKTGHKYGIQAAGRLSVLA